MNLSNNKQKSSIPIIIPIFLLILSILFGSGCAHKPKQDSNRLPEGSGEIEVELLKN